MLSALGLVLDPDTHFRLETNEFGMEKDLINWQKEDLSDEWSAFETFLDSCQGLVKRLDSMMHMVDDDQNPTVFTVTVVAIVFLGFSLISSYLCMDSGRASSDGSRTLPLFWQAAGLLTFAVGTFCLGAANQRPLVHWLKGLSKDER